MEDKYSKTLSNDCYITPMNKLFLPLVLIFAALFACSKSTQSLQSNKIVLECGIEITSIADQATEMDISLFSGVLTEEQKRVYMPEGKAPASVNVFLVKTAGKTYMLDAGFGNAAKDGRIDPSNIDGVFITHKHGDHIMGLLQDDNAAFSAPIYISKPESDYWLSEETANSELQKKLANIYEDRYNNFAFGDVLAPGIVAVDASGHTPGHTAFLIGSGKQKMLIAGDFLHAAALQFPEPTESASYDIDPEAAVKMRVSLMEMAEKNDWLIAGMHIPNLGWGKVKSNGKGGFDFTQL